MPGIHDKLKIATQPHSIHAIDTDIDANEDVLASISIYTRDRVNARFKSGTIRTLPGIPGKLFYFDQLLMSIHADIVYR